MKNLIPYNLFEMAKLNIQDYIKDIEHIRDSADYFNSKYKELELNDKILNVDFKLPSNNGLSARLFGIAAVVGADDDNEYNIIRLRIVESPSTKLYWVAYYLIVDSDCNLTIYYQLSGKKSSRIILLSKISINLLKDRDKLIKVMFDNIKDHNESLNEMAKYETDEVVKDIKSFMQYAKNHENSIQTKLNLDVILFYYYFLKLHDVEGIKDIIEIVHNEDSNRRMIKYYCRRKNGIKKSETFHLEINYSYNGITFRMIIENENNGERWIEQEKVLPYVTIKNESKLMDKFIDWCNEFLYDEH
jgi:hypothetical protein